MQEFQEISHTGGKIAFLHDPDQGTAIQITHSNPWAATLHQVCVSFDGEILDFVPIGGIGRVIPYPQPSMLAFVISDREGFFGRRCPQCKSYFRSNFLTSRTVCPYCGHRDKGVEFLTENQIQFIGNFCNTYLEAHREGETVTIDLDALVDQLPGNKPGWVYKEERQQSQHKCTQCRCLYDILGDYGVCPFCGQPNFAQVISKKLNDLAAKFEDVDENVADRHEREVEWEKLTRCVSEFEALANTMRTHLLQLPATPRRKADLSRLSFQRIIQAAERIEQWYGIEILYGVSQEDREFLNKMFNRRHIFTHNAGRVDQEYIDNTGDTSVRLNQVIRFRSREIKRLIPLIRTCSKNLIERFESLK
jgi:hypothetical protein